MTRKDLYSGPLGPYYETARLDIAGEAESKKLREAREKALEELSRGLTKSYIAWDNYVRFLKESFYLRGFTDGMEHAGKEAEVLEKIRSLLENDADKFPRAV